MFCPPAHYHRRCELPGPAVAFRVFCVLLLPKASGWHPLHLPRGKGLLCGLLQKHCGQKVQQLPESHYRFESTHTRFSTLGILLERCVLDLN